MKAWRNHTKSSTTNVSIGNRNGASIHVNLNIAVAHVIESQRSTIHAKIFQKSLNDNDISFANSQMSSINHTKNHTKISITFQKNVQIESTFLTIQSQWIGKYFSKYLIQPWCIQYTSAQNTDNIAMMALKNTSVVAGRK